MATARIFTGVGLVAATAGLAAPGAAAHARHQPPPVGMTQITPGLTGWVGVELNAPAGASVTLSEATGAAPVLLRTVRMPGPVLRVQRVVAWHCNQRVRTLHAVAVAPDGAQSRATVTVRTPSCADRFSVQVRPRTAPRAGRALRVRVTDRWRTGGEPARVCLRVGRTSVCETTPVPAAASGVTVRLRAGRAGLGRLTVSAAGFSAVRRMEVRAPRAPLRLLATGDSMIQIIDSFLAERLEPRRQATVTSDARISTGISKSFMFDWVRHASREAARSRPQATVMFIGANDGFAIGKAPCCNSDWVAAYAKRVKQMMGAYRRGGAGRVYWLTIPVPRDPARRPIYRAVNDAIKRAAADFPADEVSLIDLVRVFTPGGEYRSSINGTTVRQADGIHLNVAGARIAASVIVKQLRADGLLA